MIEGGDIQALPSASYFSKGLTCTIQSVNNQIQVKGTLQTPTGIFTSKAINAYLNFALNANSESKILEMEFGVEGAKTDTDFIAFNFKSSSDEEIYGMGLQYTIWNMKSYKVPIITSEGGVGRGLEPITSVLNLFNHNQGGNPLTTYAPAYSFITNKNYGMVFDSTAVGYADFTQKDSTQIMFWKT